MGSGSPPLPGPKPTAIPSHVLNGGSPLSSSAPTRDARDARERENLNTSIRSSFAPRIPVEFDQPESESHTTEHASSYDSPRRKSSESKYAHPAIQWYFG